MENVQNIFQRILNTDTIVDQDGFPVYKRRNNGNINLKNGIHLDNMHVVPYNPKLLKKLQAHIKWSGTIKVLPSNDYSNTLTKATIE